MNLAADSLPRFYTYMWLRKDGTPYYVGKGTRRRAFATHRIGVAPPSEQVVIYPAASDEEAIDTEIALIWYYGRKDLGLGCLRNFTDGGEGAAGTTNRKPLNLLGKVFGNLTVMCKVASTLGDSHSAWLCKCICGRETKVRSMHLKSSRVRSCGCWRAEFSLKAMHTSTLGKRLSEEHKKKISESTKGNSPWNKGKTRGACA
jgi:hypothetical protein